MTMHTIDKYAGPVVFIAAIATLLIAAAEAVANLLGFSLIAGLYTVGRLVQLASTLLILVAVLLLRQIRDALRGGHGDEQV